MSRTRGWPVQGRVIAAGLGLAALGLAGCGSGPADPATPPDDSGPGPAPTLTLLEPGPESALLGHSLRLVAQCATERPPCTVIVNLSNQYANVEHQRLVLAGDSVAATLDLAAFEGGRAFVNVLAHGAGTDTARAGSVVIVSQDAANRFVVVDSAGPHTILDADATRMVVRTPGGAAVIDRQTRVLTALSTDIILAGSHADAATLMSGGGYVSHGTYDPARQEHRDLLRGWRNGRLAYVLYGRISAIAGPWARVDVISPSVSGWGIGSFSSYALELETGRTRSAPTSNALSVSATGQIHFYSDTAIERIDATTGVRNAYPLPSGTRAASGLFPTAPVETEDGLVLQLQRTDGSGWVTLLATTQDTILLGRHDDGPDQQWPTAASRDGWTAFTGTDSGAYYCRVRGPDGTIATALEGPGYLVVETVGPSGQVIIRSATGRRYLWRPGGSISDLGTLEGRIRFIDGTAHVIVGDLLLVPR